MIIYLLLRCSYSVLSPQVRLSCDVMWYLDVHVPQLCWSTTLHVAQNWDSIYNRDQLCIRVSWYPTPIIAFSTGAKLSINLIMSVSWQVDNQSLQNLKNVMSNRHSDASPKRHIFPGIIWVRLSNNIQQWFKTSPTCLQNQSVIRTKVIQAP